MNDIDKNYKEYCEKYAKDHFISMEEAQDMEICKAYKEYLYERAGILKKEGI